MEAAAAAAAAGVHNRSTKDLNELKRQALGYYKTNKDVPRKIEDALNTLFFDSPYDIYGYLVIKQKHFTLSISTDNWHNNCVHF